MQELSAREEEIVVLKVELSNLQEKYKSILDDVSWMSGDDLSYSVVITVKLAYSECLGTPVKTSF